MKKIISTIAGMVLIGSVPLSVVACNPGTSSKVSNPSDPNKGITERDYITFTWLDYAPLTSAKVGKENALLGSSFWISVDYKGTKYLVIVSQNINPAVYQTVTNFYGMNNDSGPIYFKRLTALSYSFGRIKEIEYKIKEENHALQNYIIHFVTDLHVLA